MKQLTQLSSDILVLRDPGAKFTNYVPQGVYVVSFDVDLGFYLKKAQPFTLPPKLYGDFNTVARYLKWHNNQTKNTGILYSGLKGSGKTIEAQKLCIDSGKPVLILNQPFFQGNFLSFITNPIFHGCILFFDEFEKVYRDVEAQEGLLGLFDGQFGTNFLILMTINSDKVSEFFLNRPGRIRYRKHFQSLEDEIINEVIDDLLINKEHKASLIEIVDQLDFISFDILISLIKEMNLFKEDAKCANYLNLYIDAPQYYVSFNITDEEKPLKDENFQENFISMGYINFTDPYGNNFYQNISLQFPRPLSLKRTEYTFEDRYSPQMNSANSRIIFQNKSEIIVESDDILCKSTFLINEETYKHLKFYNYDKFLTSEEDKPLQEVKESSQIKVTSLKQLEKLLELSNIVIEANEEMQKRAFTLGSLYDIQIRHGIIYTETECRRSCFIKYTKQNFKTKISNDKLF